MEIKNGGEYIKNRIDKLRYPEIPQAILKAYIDVRVTVDYKIT